MHGTDVTTHRSRTEEGIMRRPTVRILGLVLSLSAAAVAWRPADSDLALQPGSRIWIEGTSTVRSFRCTADSIKVRVASTGAGAVGAVMSGAKAVLGAELRVPVRWLECRNGTMNEHMRKALKSAEQPVITFTVSSYELAGPGGGAPASGTASGSATGTATGELTMGGVARTITVAATVTAEPGGVLRIAGTHELRMTEYGLKPPSLMMGTMKVNELVKVNFDLVLKD